MSAKADGSIMIDTKIDTSGIDEAMESLGKEIDKSTDGIQDVGKKVGEEFSKGIKEGIGEPLSEPLEEETLNIQSRLNTLSGSMTKFGTKSTLALTTPLTALGGKMIESAAEMNAASAQFSQVFGNLESDAASSLGKIADDTGIVEERLKGSYTQIAAFAKTSGLDTADALELSNRAMVAVADSVAFYDRSLEETAESLRSFLKGNYENDAALGLSATETTRNAAAMELYGKAFNDLSEAQKQFTLLKMVEDANALSGALGQASRESETWSNVTGNLNQEFTNLLATLGQNLLPLVTPIVKFISDLLGKFGEMSPAVQKIIVGVGLVVAAIGPLSMIIGGLISAVSAVSGAITAMGAAFLPIVAVIAAVAAVVGVLIAAFTKLWNENEGFRENILATWERIKAAFTGFVDGIKERLNSLGFEFGSMSEVITTIWNTLCEFLAPVFEGAFDTIATVLETVFDVLLGLFDIFAGVFTGDWDRVWEGVKNVFTSIFEAIKEIGGNLMEGIFSVISTVAGKIKENFLNTFELVKAGLTLIWDKIVDKIKNSINGIIAIINFMIDAVVNGIDKVIGLLNNFKIEIPEWVPEWGGKEFALNIPKLEAPKIPYLASGAVIPPNAPFMAMLGDQKHGTNIEAPLDTIKQAVAEVMANMQNHVTFEIVGDPHGMFRVVRKEAEEYFETTGNSAFPF